MLIDKMNYLTAAGANNERNHDGHITCRHISIVRIFCCEHRDNFKHHP